MQNTKNKKKKLGLPQLNIAQLQHVVFRFVTLMQGCGFFSQV